MTAPAVEPYIRRNAGDLVTAEDWNTMQNEVKTDIAARIATAKDEVKREGVDKAKNADRFAEMSEKDLTDKLDTRYAPRSHNHEGQSVYKRFIKEFSDQPGYDAAILEHGFGSYPLVDVYELQDVVRNTDGPYMGCKVLFYYGHADADELGLREPIGRERIPIGIPFEQMLNELKVVRDDNDTIEDAISDMRNQFMADPNDEIKHCEAPWLTRCCGERRTIGELKEADQWPDLRLAIRPRKCGRGADLLVADGLIGPYCQVEILHANYDTVVARVAVAEIGGNYTWPMDLMFLLRA